VSVSLACRAAAPIVALLAVLIAGGTSAAELKPWTGKAAPPDLVLKDLAGHEHRLSDYRGKVVLVNFWATWCEPCREEMPSMQRLQEHLAGRPFAILAVDFGEGDARIKAFLDKLPLKFTVLLDRDGAAAHAWSVRVLPVSFVIDADQKIRYAVTGDAQWDSPTVEQAVRRLLPPGAAPGQRAGHNSGSFARSGEHPHSQAQGADSWIDVRF
jgi:cytochrome c biogenesis protein CcmG, thiol:disulfide interchange protein DsbE